MLPLYYVVLIFGTSVVPKAALAPRCILIRCNK